MNFHAPNLIRDGFNRPDDEDETDERDRAEMELREYILEEQRQHVRNYQANEESVARRQRKIA
jgi:hypothetical protein